MGIEGMPLQIGMMMTVFLAAYGIANVVLSPLGDYLGPRKAMMLCILIWTIALMVGGVATSFALIIICRILLGIGEGFYYPLQSVFIKNWFPKQERGRANAAWIVGQSVAPAIAMPFFTWWIGTHGWRSNFFLCAALGLIPLWLLWRYVADKPEQHKSISEQELAYIKAGQETESAGNSESFYVAGQTGDHQLLLLVAGAVVPVPAMPVLGDDYLATDLSKISQRFQLGGNGLAGVASLCPVDICQSGRRRLRR